MKRKPWSLIILAILHILSPVGNLILNGFYNDRTLSEQWTYWFELLPKALLFMYIVVPILAGVFIYICRRWSYWAYIACIMITLISNFYSFSTYLTTSSLIVAAGLAVLDIFVVAYFMVPSVQRVYFDQRMRWWEAAPRYHFDTEGTANGEKALFTSLSVGGIFIATNKTLAAGDKVDVAWNFGGTEQHVKGEVVYVSQNSQNPGYGVRFDHIPETANAVRSVVEKLHKDNRIVVDRLPGADDSFMVWLKKVLTSGEGLFPRSKA